MTAKGSCVTHQTAAPAPTIGRRLRPLLVPALFTLVAGACLIALGIWQVHRLAWKENLLATIDRRTNATPEPLPPPAAWPTLKPVDYEYRRVALTGTLDNGKETPVFGSTPYGVGFYVMTPMHLEGGGGPDGGVVLVNRGYVPPDRKDPATRRAGEPTGVVRIVGLMRAPEHRGLFTPADDPAAGQYFSRDPAVLAARDGLVGLAAINVAADTTPNPGGSPIGGATVIAIPNNHFVYALTWFGTALSLFAMFGSYAWRRLARGEDEGVGYAGAVRGDPPSSPTWSRALTER